MFGLGLMLALAALAPARAQEPFREDDGFLRIKLKGRDVRLEMLIVKPEAAQHPLPLALITHGKSPNSAKMGELRAASYATVARDLARRGWLAAVVMRRGFGQSDGPYPVTSSCANPDLTGRFEADADELEGALRVLQTRPDVDPQRAIAIGESAGGAAILALARRKPAGLRGIVNVAGGLNLEDCIEKGRDALVASVRSWQVATPIPQLWIYALNDELFPPLLVDRMRTAALDGDGDIRFIELPEIKPVGHLIFKNGQARYAWLREMDTSLKAWKLPALNLDRARELYAKLGFTTRADIFERYFSAPGEKAMAVSPSRKSFGYWYGADALDRAKENALRECSKASSDCVISFENDQFKLAN